MLHRSREWISSKGAVPPNHLFHGWPNHGRELVDSSGSISHDRKNCVFPSLDVVGRFVSGEEFAQLEATASAPHAFSPHASAPGLLARGLRSSRSVVEGV